MFLIPLNQLESVELVVHALKIAAGQADCSTCPARKVCMQQCATIATAVEDMLRSGTLPQLGESPLPPAASPANEASVKDPAPGRGSLKLVK